MDVCINILVYISEWKLCCGGRGMIGWILYLMS